MVRLLLALATTLILAAPAAAYVDVPAPVRAPACHRSPAARPRVVATRASTASRHAAIVACDRARGRRTTLRRGYVGDGPGVHFPLLSAPAVRGTEVAWSEFVPGAHRRPRQDLRRVDVRHPARQSHRRIGPIHPSATLPLASELMQVLAVPGGGLAYISYGADPSTLVLQEPGHTPRVLTKRLFGLARVDDGHTLVWPQDGHASLDLTPVPRDASGCPIRSRFGKVVRDTPEVRVTVADYGPDEEVGSTVRPYRVCWKATGQDAIVFTSDFFSVLEGQILAQGPYVALPYKPLASRDPCPSKAIDILVADARTGRLLPGLGANCAAVRALVLGADGVPAWIIDPDDGGERVETPGARTDTVLDSGPPGSLADLAAAPGGGFTWTHDGAPRATGAR